MTRFFGYRSSLSTENLLSGINGLDSKLVKQLKNAIELFDMEGMTQIIADISSEAVLVMALKQLSWNQENSPRISCSTLKM